MSGTSKGLALAVVLDPGGAQTSEAVFIDGGLPVQKFIDAQCVAVTGLFEA
jgi:hypothetical protein